MLIDTIAGSTNSSPPMTLINVIGDTAVPGNSYINEYSAMSVPAFWSGVRFLAETIAGFRRAVHQETADSRVEDKAHPLNTLLRRRISDVSTPYRTFETWIHHATVWGNGYLWVKRDSRGRPSALLNLNPEITTPFLHNGQKYVYVGTQTPIILDDADVLHLAVIGFDGVKGYPVVQLLRFGVEVGKQAELYTRDYFKRGTVVRGALEFPNALTPEQMATLREDVRDFKSEEGQRRFQLMVLQAGGHLNNSTVPNDTSQLLETRKFSDIVVCQILRISPHIIYQLDSQKLANVQQMGAEVVKYSLTPWLVKIEDEINLKLFSNADQDAGYTVKLHPDALLRGDSGALSTQLMAEVNGGIRTVNEARRLLDLEPVGPEGDRLRVPVNFPTTPGTPANPAAIGPAAPPLPDDAATAPDQPPPPAGTQEDDAATEGLPGATVIDPKQAPASYAANTGSTTHEQQR